MQIGRCLLPGLLLAASQLWGGAGECPSAIGFPVAITATSATRARLFFQAPDGSLPSGTITYHVYVGTSPGSLAQLTSTKVPLLTDGNLAPATTYYYAIEASSNGSSISGSACVTTPPLPFAPANLAAVVESSSAVRVTWQEDVVFGSLAIRVFKLYRGSSPSDLAEIAAVSGVSYVDHGVSPGGTYYYAVQAIDVDGDGSGISATAVVTLPN
jgi:hypothetical protein